MIAFAAILARSNSKPEDGLIKLIFFGVVAVIWIISGVASALSKKKSKFPGVPQPWQPSPPPLPVPLPTASRVDQRRPRQATRPRLQTQIRKPMRGPAEPPPLPHTRAELPPVAEVMTAISNTAALRGTTGPAPITRIRELVGTDLRRAVLMAEVLGTPVSMR
ncbi:MAG: hypothetical protein ABSH20_06310 [Tepidisphaeraceae bacterium]|jgi:hypothetical protein